MKYLGPAAALAACMVLTACNAPASNNLAATAPSISPAGTRSYPYPQPDTGLDNGISGGSRLVGSSDPSITQTH